MKTIVTPPDYLAGLISVVTNTTYDFSEVYPMFSDLPKTGNFEIMPSLQTMPKFDFTQFQSALINNPRIQFPELASISCRI